MGTVSRILGWPFRMLARIKLTHWILISMVVGVLLGWLAPSFAKELKPFANVFLRMIKTLIVPLIFSTLVVGIAGHGDDLAMLGRLALKSLIYFEVVTTIALAIGLIAVNILRPGDGITLAGASAQKGQEFSKKVVTLESELDHIIPESFWKAAADNEVLQIVVCSIVFAVGIVKLPRKDLKHAMIIWCESMSEIMFKVTEIVMMFAPFGIGGAMASTIGQSGLGVLVSLGKLIGSLYLTLAIFVVIVLLPIVFIARLPLREFLRCVGQPVLIAFSTASSEAALPKAMENLQAFGITKKVVAFVMPTGYSFNLDGTTLYLSMAAIFSAQAGGIELPLDRQIVMMLTLMLTSKGVAGVPRASLVVLSGALANFGLPLEAVALILGVDAVMDMARTSVNLLGNCLATCVIGKWEGEYRNADWRREQAIRDGVALPDDLDDEDGVMDSVLHKSKIGSQHRAMEEGNGDLLSRHSKRLH